MVYTENRRFEWDELKEKSKFLKHGVRFKDSITAFDDPDALIVDDVRHSSALEIRNWLIGMSDSGVVVVVFTLRDPSGNIRMISARRANKNERKRYEKEREL